MIYYKNSFSTFLSSLKYTNLSLRNEPKYQYKKFVNYVYLTSYICLLYLHICRYVHYLQYFIVSSFHPIYLLNPYYRERTLEEYSLNFYHYQKNKPNMNDTSGKRGSALGSNTPSSSSFSNSSNSRIIDNHKFQSELVNLR
jgi:hypothetical protein